MRVLLIENNEDDVRLVQERLARTTEPVTLSCADRLSTGLERLAKGDIDVVLLDLGLPDSQGLETFTTMHTRAPAVPIVALTGSYADEQIALQAVQAGAQDYLLKDHVDGETLIHALRYAIGRKRSEAALTAHQEELQAANRKLQELSSFKDRLLTTVSHELRTPLTAIKEGVSLLMDGALGALSAEQGEFLKTVNQSADQLTELITNMLNLARIEAGRLRLIRRRVALPSLIDTTFATLRPIAGSRTLTRDGGPAPDVFADPNRVLQILGNLLSNAVKFTSAQGTIQFLLTVRDGAVAVSIQDDGIGIAPGDLPKLFQKFSQVGRGEGPRQGSGLGLALCKELVELHKGTISVTSALGTGTTVTFTLPLYTPRFALEDSFRELAHSPERGGQEPIGLIALEGEAPFGPDHGEPLTQRVRDHLHYGDLVLGLEPGWVVILAITEADGARAIVRRLRTTLPEWAEARIGTALYPADGTDVHALLSHAMEQARGGVPREAPQGPAQAGTTRRIMLADDNPAILEVTRRRLEYEGYAVVTARDGQEAIEQALAHLPVHLMLLDIDMPRMNGYDVCRQLKSHPLTTHVPVILVTGSEPLKADLADRCIEVGAVDGLTKPFQTKELLEKIHRVLGEGA